MNIQSSPVLISFWFLCGDVNADTDTEAAGTKEDYQYYDDDNPHG